MCQGSKALQSLGYCAGKSLLSRKRRYEEDVLWSTHLVGAVGTTCMGRLEEGRKGRCRWKEGRKGRCRWEEGREGRKGVGGRRGERGREEGKEGRMFLTTCTRTLHMHTQSERRGK